MTDLTVLMPTYNRASMLRTTLEALCRVRVGALSVAIVVIDNGSSDDTSAVLREFASRLPLVVLREPRPGKCRALNHALRTVQLGELVVFTDDDVTPDPSWFEAIVATAQRWPQHSVFGGRIDAGWPSGVPMPFWASDRNVQIVAFTAHHMSDREGPYPADAEPFGPNYWVRRAALTGLEFREDLGPHPTRRTLSDETEFLRRLRAAGFAPVYSSSARVVHRIEQERTTEAALFRRAFQCGRGTVHLGGMPEAALLKRSVWAWHTRILSNLVLGGWQILEAALDPDEKLRFTRRFARTITFGRNLEALRHTWAQRASALASR